MSRTRPPALRAAWLSRPETQELMTLLDGRAGRTRVVGGAVRDTLLGRMGEGGDIDMATELLPEDVMGRAVEAGLAVYATGIAHGTVTVIAGPARIEVTTLRQDVETDGRRAKVVFGTDWAADAARRDFTLNALYADMDGTILDPVGGIADCLAGRVRFIGDPDRRLAEDALRAYRFFRFTASHGHGRADPGGLAACGRAVPRLGLLSAERVGQEMMRLLGLGSIDKVLKAMDSIGMLGFPPRLVEALARYERRAPRPNRWARLALIVGAMDEARVQESWRLSREAVGRARAIRAAAALLMVGRVNAAAYRHANVIADGLEVAAVEAGWTAAAKGAIHDQLGRVSFSPFPLTGDDLLAGGWRPGPELGRELERLEELWIASGFALDRQALLDEAGRALP